MAITASSSSSNIKRSGLLGSLGSVRTAARASSPTHIVRTNSPTCRKGSGPPHPSMTTRGAGSGPSRELCNPRPSGENDSRCSTAWQAWPGTRAPGRPTRSTSLHHGEPGCFRKRSASSATSVLEAVRERNASISLAAHVWNSKNRGTCWGMTHGRHTASDALIAKLATHQPSGTSITSPLLKMACMLGGGAQLEDHGSTMLCEASNKGPSSPPKHRAFAEVGAYNEYAAEPSSCKIAQCTGLGPYGRCSLVWVPGGANWTAASEAKLAFTESARASTRKTEAHASRQQGASQGAGRHSGESGCCQGRHRATRHWRCGSNAPRALWHGGGRPRM
mmetsp:Transcript_65445/g.212969  ORF Transcript_65445/g.212969 Transcript_65445/m.212969 type:complete len:334 (+) Transcript_65445:313-1314(+)